jgi:large subunit ribosomal protein L25
MEAQVLQAEPRKARGTTSARKLRHEGKIPAVLYGRGGENVLLSVGSRDLGLVLQHGVRVLDLDIAGASETVMIKSVQYDPMGDEPVHVDFTRIVVGEKIRLRIPVELVGTAPGVVAGGVLDHPVSDIEIECFPTQIPESVRVSIKTLEIDQMITVGDLVLPEGVAVLTDRAQILATIHPPLKEEVVAEAVPTEGVAPAEPEVIGAKEREEKKAAEEAKEKGKE